MRQNLMVSVRVNQRSPNVSWSSLAEKEVLSDPREVGALLTGHQARGKV